MAVAASASDLPADPPTPEPVVREPGFERVEQGVIFTLPLKAGTPPCSLVLEGTIQSEGDPHWVIVGLRRISTEPSPACGQQVLFDMDTEEDGMDLAGGVLIPPGEPPDSEVGLGFTFEDYDFDGYLDLGVMSMMGNFANAFRYWTYDPGSKRFVHQKVMAELGNLSLDAEEKTLSSMLRSGNLYAVETYGWIDGKLVVVRQVQTWLGTTPDGQPVNGRYERVEERRSGGLVVVREGVVKD